MNWQTLGFDKNKRLFEGVLKNGFFSHAYLFSGQEMIGKKTFAIELANLVTGATLLSNPDILIVNSSGSESGQSIAVEEVRRIKHFVSFSPYVALYKFIIIDDTHLMTVEAQNALLKMLEEPNASSIFILVTAYPDALLPTIVSRCQEIKFFPHQRELLDGVFADAYDTGGTSAKLSKANCEFLVEFADSRIGLVKYVIEENSFDQIGVAIKKIMQLVKVDINERLEIAQKLTDDKNKADLPRVVFYWTLYLRTRLSEPKAQKMLKGLLTLNEVVNKPQYNQRLALENFLVQL